MKTKILSLSILLMTIMTFGQEIKKPTEGKSLVYFVRYSGTGSLINFKYFDGEKYLGKAKGANYFIYECEPGDHLFWAASENRDFIKATLQANETYIIEVKPKMGAFKAAVRLNQVSPDNEKVLKKIKKVLLKRKPSVLKGKEKDMSFFIKNSMERYNKIKDEVKTLNTNWTF